MKEVIDFKIGDEYKEGDILKTREGIYLLVEKTDNKHCVKCCSSNDAYSKTGYILRIIVVQETDV